MFQVDPEGSQQMFEQMEVEPQVREIETSSGDTIRYYVYTLV
jgi:hypothetical protein